MNETTTQLHPSFLTRMQHLLGPEYPAFLASFDAPRTYGLRLNTSKITSEAFEKLAPFSITPIPLGQKRLLLQRGYPPLQMPLLPVRPLLPPGTKRHDPRIPHPH